MHPHQDATALRSHDRPIGYGVGQAEVTFAFDTPDRPAVRDPGGGRPADLPLLAQGDAP
jgi:hypothetical protein